MPPRRRNTESKKKTTSVKGVIEGAGEVVEQPITDTLEKNYMPYAMSVIMSRAIPEIDGFKPSHRKLLYTMYKMGLLGSARTKSANIVGQTMKLNPHGDSAIYDTMVRLSRGYEALLHPYIDSKGNFGKYYSRDMAWAASRYTEARLDDICQELFRDIDKDTVDFAPNFDETEKEPTVLPSRFPNLLVNGTSGIAVGMATNIPPHNLREVIGAVVKILMTRLKIKMRPRSKRSWRSSKDLISRREQRSLEQEESKRLTVQDVERSVCVRYPISSQCRMESTES